MSIGAMLEIFSKVKRMGGEDGGLSEQMDVVTRV
jgi:hypothetical protein